MPKNEPPNLPIAFHSVSVLDEIQMTVLGKFDIVYVWGVLHHTGHMRRVLEISTQNVKPGGIFAVAIYNRHLTSSIWKIIKRIYNHLPALGQGLLVWTFIPLIFLANIVDTRQNLLRMRCGKDFVHNIRDCVWGYPYERASIEEMTASLKQLRFETIQVQPANVPTDCNEFVSKRTN